MGNDPNPEEQRPAKTQEAEGAENEERLQEDPKSGIELAKWQLERGFISEKEYSDIVNEHQDKLPE